MNEEPSHYALNPSSELVERAAKLAKAESARKGEPEFHMTEDMRRLSTPWSVSQVRAEQIQATDLPAGVILDAAAGSGVQLIALTTGLKRPGLAIELDPNIGLLCAANMQITGDEADLQRTMDRVLIGDGTDAENAIVAYWNSLREAGTRAHLSLIHI